MFEKKQSSSLQETETCAGFIQKKELNTGNSVLMISLEGLKAYFISFAVVLLSQSHV